MYKYIVLTLLFTISFACDSDGTSDSGKAKEKIAKVDDGKGVGEFKNVKLNNPLDATMIADGKGIYDLKCSACHKLSEKRVVGPGFKGVTERRKPEWIMNMITNVEVMLEEDPAAQKMLEECLTRMPNQNLTADDARAILEYLYNNDKDS